MRTSESTIRRPAATLIPLPSPQRTERRRQARHPAQIAEIKILQGVTRTMPGLVLDISQTGLRLGLAAPMGRSTPVKITLGRTLIIFGEVTECRRSGEGYQAGVRIQDVFHSQQHRATHIAEGHLTLYLIGEGLTTQEEAALTHHLVDCPVCRHRLNEKDARMNPLAG